MESTLFFISFLVVSAIGVPLHYVHDRVKLGVFSHWISPVNESTWEHLKLVFFPVLLSFGGISLILNEVEGFWSMTLIAELIGMALIPLLYYPIRSILGREVTFVSIGLYFVSVAVLHLFAFYAVSRDIYLFPNDLGVIGLVVASILFLAFTYFPPKIFLFKDPVGGGYGDRC